MVYNNPPVVVNALIVKDREVLLGIRNQTDGRGKYELIGGFVESGETLEDALAREVREETKCEIRYARYNRSLVGTYSDGRTVLSAVFFVLLQGTPQVTGEIGGYVWVNAPPPLRFMFADCDYEAVRSWFEMYREP